MEQTTARYMTRTRSLTPNDEHPPCAPGGGTLDMEGPMPGAPLGNKPKAFRFKPGIRLDWSWREKTAVLLIQHRSRDVRFCSSMQLILNICSKLHFSSENVCSSHFLCRYKQFYLRSRKQRDVV